eukprot:12474207-Alexandrium_andersonii.AAC.1
MSASLVGSEMCIRDSTRHNVLRGPSVAKAHRLAIRRLESRVFCGTASVSYTHLTLPTICSV